MTADRPAPGFNAARWAIDARLFAGAGDAPDTDVFWAAAPATCELELAAVGCEPALFEGAAPEGRTVRPMTKAFGINARTVGTATVVAPETKLFPAAVAVAGEVAELPVLAVAFPDDVLLGFPVLDALVAEAVPAVVVPELAPVAAVVAPPGEDPLELCVPAFVPVAVPFAPLPLAAATALVASIMFTERVVVLVSAFAPGRWFWTLTVT